MDHREIEKNETLWWEYLSRFFTGFSLTAASFHGRDSELPPIFATPRCATCKYWRLLHRGGMDQIPNPDEIELIEKGLTGKIMKSISFRVGTRDVDDVYADHEFFGWCKRYPPQHRESYSIIGFRSIFSLLTRNIPKKISDYQFPLMSHTNFCGEWSKAEWVEGFIEKQRAKK